MAQYTAFSSMDDKSGGMAARSEGLPRRESIVHPGMSTLVMGSWAHVTHFHMRRPGGKGRSGLITRVRVVNQVHPVRTAVTHYVSARSSAFLSGSESIRALKSFTVLHTSVTLGASRLLAEGKDGLDGSAEVAASV